VRADDALAGRELAGCSPVRSLFTIRCRTPRAIDPDGVSLSDE